ncbi:MAG: tetratricopeptide repeat protein [Myxococcota bacterium]
MTDDPIDTARWEAVEDATELLMEGQYADALEALRNVVQADAQNSYAYFYLGTAFYELQQLEPARDAYRAAVMLSPHYLGARVGLSQATRRLGDAGEALAEAEEALRRFPEDGDALYAAATALAQLGRIKRAVEVFRRFLQTGPEVEPQIEVQGILDTLARAPEGKPVVLP